MEKIIKIDETEYTLKSSAYTMFAYKDFTGRDLLEDVQYLNKKNKEISKLKSDEDRDDAWLNEFTKVSTMALKMCYVMIKENDESFMPYNDWLKSLNHVFGDSSWLAATMETAMAPFQR